jgi:transcriptional regulator with XRE-family HTH domain
VLKAKRPTFGRLLASYRGLRGLTQKELASVLTNSGFPISASAISKYEFGSRSPSAQLIFHVARCLDLNEYQINTLLQACVADFHEQLLKEYSAIAAEHPIPPHPTPD